MCKYCSGNQVRKDFPYGFKKITIYQTSNPTLEVVERYKDDQMETMIEINYCPFCGKKLGE